MMRTHSHPADTSPVMLHITSFEICEVPQACLNKEKSGVSRLETSEGRGSEEDFIATRNFN